MTALRPAKVYPKTEAVKLDGRSERVLAECEYFRTALAEIADKSEFEANGESFIDLLFLDGEGEVTGSGETVSFKKGDSIFVTADSGKFTVSGKCSVIITRV